MKLADKIQCPHCACPLSKVVPINNWKHRLTNDGGARRVRQCQGCGQTFSTVERVERSLPAKRSISSVADCRAVLGYVASPPTRLDGR